MVLADQATAVENVRQDLLETLGLQKPVLDVIGTMLPDQAEML